MAADEVVLTIIHNYWSLSSKKVESYNYLPILAHVHKEKHNLKCQWAVPLHLTDLNGTMPAMLANRETLVHVQL